MLEPSEFRFFGDQCLVVRSPNSADESLLLYRRHSASTPGSTLVVQDNIPLRILRLLTFSGQECLTGYIARTIGYAGKKQESYVRAQVKFLRQHLSDNAAAPIFVETVRGVGLVFCLPVLRAFGQEGARKWKELGFGPLPEFLAASGLQTTEEMASHAAGILALGTAAITHGRDEQAEPFLTEALDLYTRLAAEKDLDESDDEDELDDEPEYVRVTYDSQIATCELFLGDIAFSQGKYELARKRYEHTLALSEWRPCEHWLRRSFGIRESTSHPRVAGKAALRLVRIALKLDSLDAAVKLSIAKAEYVYEPKEYALTAERAALLKEMGVTGLAQGDRFTGHTYLYAAYLQYEANGQDEAGLACLVMTADVEREDGKFEIAEDLYDGAIELAKKLRAKATEAHCHEKQGEIAVFCGHGRDASSCYGYARDCYKEIGDQTGVERCLRALEASRHLPQIRRPRPHIWGGPSALAEY